MVPAWLRAMSLPFVAADCLAAAGLQVEPQNFWFICNLCTFTALQGVGLRLLKVNQQRTYCMPLRVPLCQWIVCI